MTRCLIILSNLMDIDGALNQESADRATLALRLFDSLSPEFVITCGWDYRPDSQLRICDVFADYLVKANPRINSPLVRIAQSRDTVGDALFSALYFKAAGITTPQHITVVTSDYHVNRTSEIFSAIFATCKEDTPVICVKGSQTPQYTYEQNQLSERRSLRAFRDTFKNIDFRDLDSALDRIRAEHPFYNGQTYPVIPHNLQIYAELGSLLRAS